jgi:hypothetical protein
LISSFFASSSCAKANEAMSKVQTWKFYVPLWGKQPSKEQLLYWRKFQFCSIHTFISLYFYRFTPTSLFLEGKSTCSNKIFDFVLLFEVLFLKYKPTNLLHAILGFFSRWSQYLFFREVEVTTSIRTQYEISF